MLRPEQLHGYQRKAVIHQLTHPATALFLSTGLGKTAVTLTSIAHMLQIKHLRAVLVVAPLRVCRLVWRTEASKWVHTKHLTFSLVMGTPEQRITALLKPADVYLINFENLKWLTDSLETYFIKKNRQLPFDGVVFDELSKTKESTTQRVRALRRFLPNHIKWRTGLTGTPAANGYKDLHGQFLVLDDGARLEVHKTTFLSKYYYKEGYRLIPFNDTQDKITELISDITLNMRAEDYLTMPDLIINDINVELPPDVRRKYDTMEREFFLKLDSGTVIESFNQASLTNRLLQLSGGSLYPISGEKDYEIIHDEKLNALEEIIEEAAGQPVLVWYQFQSEADRIMKRFKDLNPINLTKCKSERALSDAMRKWQAGDCPLMISHPYSAGHGVDGLQKSGNIMVWLGATWSLEGYLQANARLHRQGQGKPVTVHRILALNTMDQAQVMALDAKANTQEALRSAVTEYRKQRGM